LEGKIPLLDVVHLGTGGRNSPFDARGPPFLV
jgi:hypothetical protein